MFPFRDGDAFLLFRDLIDKTTREIRSLENDYVLKASQAELENYYIDKVLINPLILHTDKHYIESQTGTKLDVSNDFSIANFSGERTVVQGTRLDIAIPYEGDRILWQIKASTYSTGCPEIDVRDHEILLTVSFPDGSANSGKTKSDIDSNINSLATNVNYLKNDVDNHNRTAPESVKSEIQRKHQLAESTIEAIEKLDIPVKRRNQPLTYIVPTERRASPLSPPKVATEKYELEPELDEKEYQHILKIMRDMSSVIESNPGVFASLNEESIRTHFLLQLNGHYEGSATGETFNASGKTDILIREKSKNIFIAECKFWRGSKVFSEAVDQLLSYLAWRDTKCALVIFNKTQNSSAILQKMHKAMEARSEHIRTISHDPDGDSRYVFVKESDPGREIIITTQIYDFPALEK